MSAADYYQQDQVQPAAPRGQYGQDQSYNNYNGKEEYNQQGYPPPSQPPPQQYPPENPPSYDELFKIEKPKFNDIWAGLLLIAVFLGYVAVSGISINKYASTRGFNGGSIYGSSNDFGLDTNTLILFIFVLCVALAFSWAYFLGARYFTKQFIWITGILNCAFAIGTAIYYLYRKQWGAGIVFLVFGVFAIICFISWIPRIPFSVVMLQTAIDVSRSYGHVFIVSAVGGFVALALSAWFSVTLVSIYVAYEPNGGGTNPSCPKGGCSSAKVIGLVVFVTFAMYWVSEWLKNTIHTTIAGIYGSWYFGRGAPPKGATRGAFKRATTYSFGSISLGSLIIALVNMMRQACSIAQQQEAAQGSMVGSIAFWVLGCFIALLDWLVQFFNRYAFCHIALYGKAYIPAAKDTWTMMKDRGIDALINDCLIGPVLSMGSVFVSYVCALLAYLYLEFTRPSYNSSGTFTAVIMAYAFVIGLQICQIFLTPIGSGVDTIFVAMAWNPEILMRDHPDLYHEIVRRYPRVQQMIHA
ncbi:putative choline transporter, neither null mutation nor overexpression affects choline transport [Talaromyces marneffei ATCC 18224]|uniref:Protein PNS1 n=2 Tax=Talaromyces marneffei TaxID=37727 RepID=B6Q4X1_TALMQ|nr:DUF580 domain protein Pns1, putative [Talaromyces marneffei ATCC 18224]KAE8556978.1 hypothetical protein EYB25_001684 [Talaromyces marneffei]